MNQAIFKEVTTWQDATFGNHGNVLPVIEHLKVEIEELIEDVVKGNPVEEEFADCFILLFGAAHRAGLRYEDICKAVMEKHHKNKTRKWGKPDDKGVVRHLTLQPQFTDVKFVDQVDLDEWLKRKAKFIIDLTDMGQDLTRIWVHITGEILHTDAHSHIYTGRFIDIDKMWPVIRIFNEEDQQYVDFSMLTVEHVEVNYEGEDLELETYKTA